MIRSTYLRQLRGCAGDIAYELRVQYLSLHQQDRWTPAINAYRCRDTIVICAELAGVEKDRIEIHAEPRRVLLRGIRQAPEPGDCEGPATQVLALEIDQGPFEREITLPLEIDPDQVRAEQRNGLLWIYLPVRTEP